METDRAGMIKRQIKRLKSLGERGMSRLTVLVTLLIFIFGFYVAFQVVPFYYYHQELIGLMEGQASKASLFTDQKMRKNLLKKIHKLEIPIENDDDLQINRFNGKIVIELNYQEVLYIDFGGDRVYDLHVFDMNPRVERNF